MNIELKIPNEVKLDNNTLQKMIFINNALESGWSIKKVDEKYIFSKRHENKREVYLDSYLETFLKTNINVQNLFNK
ncbi:hypothetical protein ceV_192 [Chrysochromulina ericina virus CeV-01B]|jgi:hypothetical protein|uniref:Uncharacterized protein n=1 Tax=Chrysochromulina ericina virus CeV-01B TaxID=3070830 RepID=A0A0N9R3A8_9VIRU|nr:hypothetical protein ceV_192 [Chrysochromulina ericina virus]ALH23098.1 hypothetical protein ceV_192 [Chrysochromulina ericina virus CeV-01B]|tara:strand:+ start:307 stop:534 length:228 start_codon:yes stop_codon:yes gene_type:complete